MTVTIDDFKKIEIKIGEIIEAEKIEGSDRLLKLKVNFGQETRQIISGITRYYQPEELLNKQVAFATNLEPRSIMGLESQGMILACDSVDGLALLSPNKKVEPGTQIR